MSAGGRDRPRSGAGGRDRPRDGDVKGAQPDGGDVDRAHPRVVGVVLAAGAATRFGSPKQLAELDGRPLVLHALEALLAVPALEEVLVVVGAHGDAVAAVAEPTGARVVDCPEWEQGMAASLRTGVAAADEAGADAVLVHLADLPRITPQVVAAVLDHAHDDDGRLRDAPTRASYDGAPGHPAVLPRALFSAVAALRGDHGARDLLAGPDTIRFEAGHLADPTDVDTPETLESLT